MHWQRKAAQALAAKQRNAQSRLLAASFRQEYVISRIAKLKGVRIAFACLRPVPFPLFSEGEPEAKSRWRSTQAPPRTGLFFGCSTQMTTDELLDLVRAKHSLRSEAQLAGALGIPESKLAQYRRKSRPVDADLAWMIADLLKRPPAEVIAVAFFEAETDPAKRKRWRDRLTDMGVLES